MSEEYLIHYGVKGMKWGVRKKSKQNNFDTRFRPTTLDQRGRLLRVNEVDVNYKNKNHRKAARAALRAGYKYKGTQKDRLSLMGNTFVESLKNQKVPTKDFDKNVDDIRESKKLYEYNKKNNTNLELIKTDFGYVYQNPNPKKRKGKVSGKKIRDYSEYYRF